VKHCEEFERSCVQCDSALGVCEVQSVDQVLDQKLTRPEKELKEEVAEEKTLLDSIKELEAARKYMCLFDTKNNIILMCNKVENELYRLRTKKKKLLLTG
jgi:hypothetical protein